MQTRIVRKTSHTDNDEHKSEEEEREETNGVSHAEEHRRQADVCFETLVNITESNLVSIRQLNIKTLARILYDRYDLSSSEYAEALIRARAPFLLELLENVQPGGPNLTKRAIYRELLAASEVENQEVSYSPLRERSPPAREGEQSDNESPIVRRGHHRKSVLRPPRYSSKAADRFGSRKRAKPPDSDAEDSPSKEEEEPPSIIHSHPRPSPLVSRPKSMSHLEGSSNREVSVFSNPASIEHQSPDLTPNGPGDTWICSNADCTHVVQKASTKRSKGLIQDHILTHANDSRAKIDLVLTEQRYHLPIRYIYIHTALYISSIESLTDLVTSLVIFRGWQPQRVKTLPVLLLVAHQLRNELSAVEASMTALQYFRNAYVTMGFNFRFSCLACMVASRLLG